MSNAIAQQATNLAISAPKDLDLTVLVREVAERQSRNGGYSYVTKQGKNHIRSAVAALVKVMTGVEKSDRLSDELMAKVDLAIGVFFAREVEKLLSYGEITRVTWDKPLVTFSEEGKVENIGTRATVTAEKYFSDSKERRLNVTFLLTGARERLERIVSNPGKYSSEQASAARRKVNALEVEYQRLAEVLKTPQ